jgi:hypothetical protein
MRLADKVKEIASCFLLRPYARSPVIRVDVPARCPIHSKHGRVVRPHHRNTIMEVSQARVVRMEDSLEP